MKEAHQIITNIDSNYVNPKKNDSVAGVIQM